MKTKLTLIGKERKNRYAKVMEVDEVYTLKMNCKGKEQQERQTKEKIHKNIIGLKN